MRVFRWGHELLPPQSYVTSVGVTPASATVAPGNSQAFKAAVAGTGSYSSAVSWAVNSIPGGNQSFGVISTSGVYTAPAIEAYSSTVTVTATSTQDTSKSGSSSVQISASTNNATQIQVFPTGANLSPGWSQQFGATVNGNGDFNAAVNWQVDGIAGGNGSVGTVDSTGLYSAPMTAAVGTQVFSDSSGCRSA